MGSMSALKGVMSWAPFQGPKGLNNLARGIAPGTAVPNCAPRLKALHKGAGSFKGGPCLPRPCIVVHPP